MGPEIGPFSEFLQLTYDELRSGPDGEFIAGLPIIRSISLGKGWFIQQTIASQFGISSKDRWSDLVLYAKLITEDTPFIGLGN
jgi:hypothetical protein